MAFHVPAAAASLPLVTLNNRVWSPALRAAIAPWQSQPCRARRVAKSQYSCVSTKTKEVAAARLAPIKSFVGVKDSLTNRPLQNAFFGSVGGGSARHPSSKCTLFTSALRTPNSRRRTAAGSLGITSISSKPFSSYVQSSRPQLKVGFSYTGSVPRYGLVFKRNFSRELLVRAEQTANNNPTSATAQSAFYTALIRAGLPQLVIDRYQSGQYATNVACHSAYMGALELVGQSSKASAIPASLSAANNEVASPAQLQAVGQAVAAHMQGGNLSTVKSTGASGSPLYVVIQDSFGSKVFKWTKFFLWYVLSAYFFFVTISLVVDFSGFMRRMGSGQNPEVKPELQTTRFSDVQGCDEAKEEVQELVDFLRNPGKFSALGGKLPKGVLLVGPPGTGKTLLARAVAGEAGVPFFYMSGSEFDEVYVGVGAKRIRELFNAARAKAPAIVFIDELDAIGGKRNERDAAYVKQTLNQLLTDLDGFDQNSGVIFIAATNFPQLLDPALTRPGRFDRHVNVSLPSVRGRIAILKHHMRNIQIGTDVDAAVIARGTPGFSGADLENVVNQAAVRASKQKARKVRMVDLEWARERILMGAERRSQVVSPKEKEMTAYHEGGHALVAMFTKHTDPLYKASIMPRGPALGITTMLPEIDKFSTSKKELLARIDVCMGGKAAEELVYGPDNVTSGVSADLQAATSVAYSMVTQLGMSDALGNMDLHSDYTKLSSVTKMRIEDEVKRLLKEGHQRAAELLESKRRELDLLARALLEYETLGKEEMEKVVRGEKLPEKLSILPDAPMKLPDVRLPGILGGSTSSDGPPGSGNSGGTSPAPQPPFPAGGPHA